MPFEGRLNIYRSIRLPLPERPAEPVLYSHVYLIFISSVLQTLIRLYILYFSVSIYTENLICKTIYKWDNIENSILSAIW